MGGDTRETPEVLEIVWILNWVVITHVYLNINIHGACPLQLGHSLYFLSLKSHCDHFPICCHQLLTTPLNLLR